MPRIFSYQQQSEYSGTTDVKKLADKLIPSLEGPVINVIEKFPWTLTPINSPARNETPYIKLKEFYLLDSYINQLLKSYGLRTIQNNPVIDALGILSNLGVIRGLDDETQLYEGLYDHDNKTGFEYKFPYFENGQTNVNNWTQKSTYDMIVYYQQKLAPYTKANDMLQALPDLGAFNQLIPGLAGMRQALEQYTEIPQSAIDIYSGQGSLEDWIRVLGLGGTKMLPYVGPALSLYESASRMLVMVERASELINIALQSPMASLDSDPVIDKPTIWTSSQPRSFTVAFPLFNTSLFSDFDAEQTITRNWELCYLLAYQNSYNKRNLFTGLPPVFYEIEIPGIHYTKAGYVNSLNILNIGNTRALQLPIGKSGEKRTVNVPDAYFITMNLIDFFMPSKNFLDTLNNPTARNRVKTPFRGGRDLPPDQNQPPDWSIPPGTPGQFPGMPPIPDRWVQPPSGPGTGFPPNNRPPPPTFAPPRAED